MIARVWQSNGVRILRLVVTSLALGAACTPATLSPLASRGYAVLPAPQRVTLGPADFRFGTQWRVELASVSAGDPAPASLAGLLAERFHIALEGKGPAVRLAIAPGSVHIGEALDRDKDAIAGQAYRLELAPKGITITANASAGLFYGVQTLVQLLKPRDGALYLPEASITDWPDLQLRQIYWDDAHHLDRPEVFRQAIRQAAFYKINGFIVKFDGHFQYRTAPAVVEPYAFSAEQVQELTNYALQHHVQLIPYLDSPAHVAFILKHPEYASLRAFPDSNYEICSVNPDAFKLLSGMYQELIDATKGSKYFYLSTDEAYYVGMANNAQCNEAALEKKLGTPGKVLAEFVTRAANFIHDRGRTVVFWGEFPLRPGDIASLPSHLVNGEVYGPAFDPLFKAHGIRSTIYTSTQGEEPLFPDYFVQPTDRRLHPGRPTQPRVEGVFHGISTNPARKNADLFGTVEAAWADAGLHGETFWLGYAAGQAAAWHPAEPDPRESMNAFYPLFYGWGALNMDRVYQLMSTQAQFWADSWERGPSKSRKPIWGSSNRIFNPPQPAHDQFLALPPVPGADLAYTGNWGRDNARRLALAAQFKTDLDELTSLLYSNIQRVSLNQYNLEVFLSIAEIYRQNLAFLQDLGRIDSLLTRASEAARNNQGGQAVGALDQALALAAAMRDSRERVLKDVTETWYKSMYPRVKSANGRTFLHVLDDVKDHPGDRTIDLGYLVERQTLLPLDDWTKQLRAVRDAYAAKVPPSQMGRRRRGGA